MSLKGEKEKVLNEKKGIEEDNVKMKEQLEKMEEFRQLMEKMDVKSGMETLKNISQTFGVLTKKMKNKQQQDENKTN